MNSDLQSRSGISYMNSVLPVQHNFLSTPRPNCLDFHTCKMGIILIPFTGDGVINVSQIVWRSTDFNCKITLSVLADSTQEELKSKPGK